MLFYMILYNLKACENSEDSRLQLVNRVTQTATKKLDIFVCHCPAGVENSKSKKTDDGIYFDVIQNRFFHGLAKKQY